LQAWPPELRRSVDARFRRFRAKQAAARFTASPNHDAGTSRQSHKFRFVQSRRPSEVGEQTLKRIVEATGGITAGIFSLMTMLAIAAIKSGEERIAPGDVADRRNVQSLLGEPV